MNPEKVLKRVGKPELAMIFYLSDLIGQWKKGRSNFTPSNAVLTEIVNEQLGMELKVKDITLFRQLIPYFTEKHGGY